VKPSDTRRILELIVGEHVRFVVIGGLAMVSHGAATVTLDLDVCYERSDENLRALERALTAIRPTLRGAPADLPFRADAPTLKAGLNFTLDTDAGPLDLVGEIAGVGGFREVAADAQAHEIFGHSVLVMSLSALIRSKQAAGRPKDRLHLLELAEILRQREVEPQPR